MPDKTPEYVLAAMIEVRGGAKYNMLDSNGVVREMIELGHLEAAEYLIDYNPYRRGDVDVRRYMDALYALGERVNEKY